MEWVIQKEPLVVDIDTDELEESPYGARIQRRADFMMGGYESRGSLDDYDLIDNWRDLIVRPLNTHAIVSRVYVFCTHHVGVRRMLTRARRGQREEDNDQNEENLKKQPKRKDHYTREQCEAWARNQSENPVTGRYIDPVAKDGLYKKIKEYCESQYGIKTVFTWNGVSFPSTSDEWNKLIRECRARLLVNGNASMITRGDRAFYEMMITFYEYAEAHDAYIDPMPIAQQDLVKMVSDCQQNMKKLNVEVISVQDLSKMLFHRLGHYLMSGTPLTMADVTKIYNHASLWYKYYDIQGSRELMGHAQDVMQVIQTVELELAENQQEALEELPDSRLRSSPSSQSAESDRSRKYASSYRRHSKLSNVSPFLHASPNVPVLDDKKTRQQLLKELKAVCVEMRDTITYERFDRMNKKNLLLIVKLGEGQHTKRCYYVRNIYNAWKQAVADNKPFVDPLTRAPVTTNEKDDIMRKLQYLKKQAKDPREMVQRKPKTLRISFTLEDHPDDDGVVLSFYHVRVYTRQNFGTRVFMLMDLGYFPANIEPEDMGGALNMSSAVLANNIKTLFENGRLMASNVAPYTCCRVHLRKPVHYWFDPQGPKGISKHRFTMMIQEIEQFL